MSGKIGAFSLFLVMQAAVLLLAPAHLSAQESASLKPSLQVNSIGFSASFSSISVSYQFSKDARSFNQINLGFETSEVMRRRLPFQGMTGEYSRCFIVAGGGTKNWDFYVGPGVIAGWSSDSVIPKDPQPTQAPSLEYRKGFVGGLKLDLGIRYHFAVPITFTAAISPSYAMILHKDGLNSSLSTYRDGLFRCFSPQVGLSYDLNRKVSQSSLDYLDSKPRLVTASIESSSNINVICGVHYNYVYDDEGFRVETKKAKVYVFSVAQLFAYVNFNLCDKFSLSLGSGCEGLSQLRSIAVPLLLKGTGYFGEASNLIRPLLFAEAGPAFCVDGKLAPVSAQARLGSGVKLRLSRSTSLDLSLGLQGQMMQPLYIEGMHGITLRKSREINASVTVAAAITL